MCTEYRRELRLLLPPGGLLDSPEAVSGYAYDSQVVEATPWAVCLPETTGQVSRVMEYCHRNGIPVTPRGAASGTTGGAVPVKGGIVLSLQRMQEIEIDRENFVVSVQPGVITAELHQAVEAKGLFYPPDPASMAFSTIGGNIAENAGGMRAVKYGVTAAYVLGLEVVLPDGSVIQAGSKCIKDVVGFNLAAVFVGSEGMLGIVTRAYLRLIPLPKRKKTCRIDFVSLNDAIKAVNAILLEGIVPATLEFMDSLCIRCAREFLGIDLPDETGGLLIIEVDGSERQTEEEMSRILAVCNDFPLVGSHVAGTREESDILWQARRLISASFKRVKPFRFNEDIVVPRARISEMVEQITMISQKYNLLIASFGHAGDGNIHVNVLFGDGPEEEKRAHQAVETIFATAAALEGRISGEHGIGIAKQAFLPLNLDRDTIQCMRDLKRTVDPKGILNPGKVFPEEKA